MLTISERTILAMFFVIALSVIIGFEGGRQFCAMQIRHAAEVHSSKNRIGVIDSTEVKIYWGWEKGEPDKWIIIGTTRGE